MTDIPSGSELARPYVPAKDLELAKRFYVRLGFEKVLDSDVAVFRVGSSGFMMQLMVDDPGCMVDTHRRTCKTPTRIQFMGK
jgi:hypothetical protein